MMRTLILFVALATAPVLVSAQAAPRWTLVTSDNPAFPTPGIGNVAVLPIQPALNDADGQSLRMQLDPNASIGGIWLRVGTGFVPVARRYTTGALGPRRQGAESTHQFVDLSQFEDAGPGPGTTFLATAGEPGGSAPTVGLWRWQDGQNRELARYGTDGALGPGLGPGWRFRSTNVSAMALNTGADGAALAQSVTSPTDAVRAALVMLRADGNQPCMLQDDPSAALGPNLGDGSVFLFGTYRTARHGERYFVNATASREGIWQVCAGPPRPIAVVQGSGSLAPDVGSGSARYTTIRTLPRPLADRALAFIASYDIDSSGPAPIRGALWWHRAGSNQLLAQTGDGSTALGPNYQGAAFEFIDSVNSTFDAAGPYIALETSALTPQNQRINGLWRWRAGTPPEPLALEGQSGAVAPGPGQTFARIDRWKLFANGDILADCQVSGGPSGLFLFARGRTPRLVLAAGQSITLDGVGSASTATVESFALLEGSDTGAADSAIGVDAWSSDDGGMAVSATIIRGTDRAAVLMRSTISDVGLLFSDGFEAP